MGATFVRGSKQRKDACTTAKMYNPTSILVTGGAGFIASHVVERLGTLYPNVKIVVLDKLDYCASALNLNESLRLPNVRFVQGDITSLDLVSLVIRSEGIDTVMHFAAQTHVDNSFGNSLSFTHNNTYGTHCLLEAARLTGHIRRFIYVSTDEVYGESSVGLSSSSAGLGEESRLVPTNPYSAAKAGAELMCLAYQTSYSMPIIITRGNNVYGPRQFPEKLVPKMIMLAARGADLPIHGDGQQVRSYLYVSDVADAFDVILHRGTDGETYNIGAEDERSVTQVISDVVDMVSSITGKEALSRTEHVADRCFNDRRYFIGRDKLEALGWKETTSWRDGLRQTAQWYLDLQSPRDWWPKGDVDAALLPGTA